MPTLIITIPATIITLLWIGTIYGSRMRFDRGRCSASDSSRSSSAAASADSSSRSRQSTRILHATYFVVAHFHFVMGVAAMFGIFAGTYFWFPKMFGRMMNETLGRWHFALTFLGVYAIFMPMH